MTMIFLQWSTRLMPCNPLNQPSIVFTARYEMFINECACILLIPILESFTEYQIPCIHTQTMEKIFCFAYFLCVCIHTLTAKIPRSLFFLCAQFSQETRSWSMFNCVTWQICNLRTIIIISQTIFQLWHSMLVDLCILYIYVHAHFDDLDLDARSQWVNRGTKSALTDFKYRQLI